MVGMLQILTYMFAFYLVVKGLEILQIGLASSREDRKGIVTLGALALCGCAIAAFGFVVLQDQQVLALSSSDLGNLPSASTRSSDSSVPSSVPKYVPPTQDELRAQEALTDAHNKGWNWAETRKLSNKKDCAQLDNSDVRYGCEAYVDAYSK